MIGIKQKDKVGSEKMGDLNTIIGKGTVVDGTFTVQSSLRVDGKIKGKVTATDSLIVGKDGEVDGEISVKNAIIGGKVKGKINASGRVVFEASSVFNGEVKTAKLVIVEGAVFNGNCLMHEETQLSKPESKPAFKAAKPSEKITPLNQTKP